MVPKMKFVLLLLFCLIFFLNACSTMQNAHKHYSTSLWSSSDPLSIPYDARLEQFEKGNLVTNPSFEEGRVISSDPGNTFILKGWKKVGQNVKWIDQESELSASGEVNDGKHAVMIAREKA
ncbi:unnamed protein product, partial [marine sediment metagenome]